MREREKHQYHIPAALAPSGRRTQPPGASAPNPATQHPPLPPPLAPGGNKNTPWALHPPSQPSPSLSLSAPPPLPPSASRYPASGAGPGGPGGPGAADGRAPPPAPHRGGSDHRRDYLAGARDYPPPGGDRYGGGGVSGVGGGKDYNDGSGGGRNGGQYRRYPEDHDDRGGRYQRERDYGGSRGGRDDHYRGDYYRSEYRGDSRDRYDGGYNSDRYGRAGDRDYRGGSSGSYQNRSGWDRNHGRPDDRDRRWGDHGDSVGDYGDRNHRVYGADGPGRGYGAGADHRSAHPPRPHHQPWPEPVQPSQSRNPYQPPPKSEEDIILEAIRERDAAEARVRRAKDRVAVRNNEDEFAGNRSNVGAAQEKQEPSEDAHSGLRRDDERAGETPSSLVSSVTASVPPVAPRILLRSTGGGDADQKNQTSGEASGDAAVTPVKKANRNTVTAVAAPGEDSVLPIDGVRPTLDRTDCVVVGGLVAEKKPQGLTASEINRAGQNSADVLPTNKDSAMATPFENSCLEVREVRPKSEPVVSVERDLCPIIEEQPEAEPPVEAEGDDKDKPEREIPPSDVNYMKESRTSACGVSEKTAGAEVAEETEEKRRHRQQQIILQQVAASRSKKEKASSRKDSHRKESRKKEKKGSSSSSGSLSQVMMQKKGAAVDHNEPRALSKEETEKVIKAAKDVRNKRRRTRRPRTQGVSYRRLPDGSFVNTDLNEEQIAKLKLKAEELKKQQDQGKVAALEKKEAKLATKETGSPLKVVLDGRRQPASDGKKQRMPEIKEQPTVTKEKGFVPAPPPAISAWTLGPPPSIANSPSPVQQSLGLVISPKVSPEASVSQQTKTDEWAVSADFPKLGDEDSEDAGEIIPTDNLLTEHKEASWIPPPVEPLDKQEKRGVIAAVGPILENVGSWNAFSNGAPISAAAADWSLDQTKVDADWSCAAHPVVNSQNNNDDDATHLTDGSEAVPRDLLSSAPGTEDDNDSSVEGKKENPTEAKDQSKKRRSGRSRRGGKGRFCRNKVADTQKSKPDGETIKPDVQKNKKSSRRAKKPFKPNDSNVGQGKSAPQQKKKDAKRGDKSQLHKPNEKKKRSRKPAQPQQAVN